jgi:TetR/AcrR family transcriptional repressor of nem operon
MLGPKKAAAATAESSAALRQRALAIAAAMIGGIAVARAVSKARPDLSDDILTAVRQVLGEVGGETTTLSGDGADNMGA